MPKILQVNYRFSKPVEDLPNEHLKKPMTVATEGAKHIATVPGLRLKTCFRNQENGEVGGIYRGCNLERVQRR